MPDISMCGDRKCLLKENCYRFKAKPNPDYQAYGGFKYDKGSGCEHIIPMLPATELLDTTDDITANIPLNSTEETTSDMVNSPSHYLSYPIEVKEIIRTVLSEEGYKGWCLGNELKYRLRAGLKNPDKLQEDMDKAMWFREEGKG